MTRLIFRFKRTLVTPTFPASSFTDVSTVPTRRHLSRALTEPSLPPRRFHLLLETLFNAAFSSLDCPFNRGRHTLLRSSSFRPSRSTHALRSVRSSSRGGKRFAKEFRGFADVAQVRGMLRLPDDRVFGGVSRGGGCCLPSGEDHPFLLNFLSRNVQLRT